MFLTSLRHAQVVVFFSGSTLNNKHMLLFVFSFQITPTLFQLSLVFHNSCTAQRIVLSFHAKLFNTFLSFCLFSVCFTLFLSLYYFILFSSVFQYNHPHTRYLAGFCLLLCFVCFFVFKRELVFGFPYFCYFYLLVSFSYLNYQRSSSVLYFFIAFALYFLVSISLARNCSSIYYFLSPTITISSSTSCCFFGVLRLLFPSLSSSSVTPACLRTHTQLNGQRSSAGWIASRDPRTNRRHLLHRSPECTSCGFSANADPACR